MKKSLFILTALVMVFALVLTACAPDTPDTPAVEDPVVEEPMEEEPVAEEPMEEATEEPMEEPTEEPMEEPTEEPAAEEADDPNTLPAIKHCISTDCSGVQ